MVHASPPTKRNRTVQVLLAIACVGALACGRTRRATSGRGYQGPAVIDRPEAYESPEPSAAGPVEAQRPTLAYVERADAAHATSTTPPPDEPGTAVAPAIAAAALPHATGGSDDLVARLREARERRENDEALQRRVRSARVVIYGAEWCGVCHVAAAWFRERGVSFTEVDVDRDREQGRSIRARARAAGLAARGLPLIEVNGQLMEGFDPDTLERWMREG